MKDTAAQQVAGHNCLLKTYIHTYTYLIHEYMLKTHTYGMATEPRRVLIDLLTISRDFSKILRNCFFYFS